MMYRKEIVKRFQNEIGCIFEGNLCFAFIFGSVAKKCEKKDSDIDMFVCTMNEPNTKQKTDFLKFYILMHQEYGFAPDTEYPGEVVSLNFLKMNIDYIQTWIPHREIKTYREFEAVFWTAVLAEQKIAVVGKQDILWNLEDLCGNLVNKWKHMVTSKENVLNVNECSLLNELTNAGCQFLVQHRPEDGGNFWL